MSDTTITVETIPAQPGYALLEGFLDDGDLGVNRYHVIAWSVQTEYKTADVDDRITFVDPVTLLGSRALNCMYAIQQPCGVIIDDEIVFAGSFDWRQHAYDFLSKAAAKGDDT